MSSMRTRKLNLTFRDEPDEIPSDEEGGVGAETIPPTEAAPQTETDTADTDANGAGEEEEEFTVEAILNKKTERGVTKYLIKWEGYDESYNTWEPLENLDCEEILEEFEKEWSKKHSYANKRKRQSQAKSSTSKVDEFDSFFNEDDNTPTSTGTGGDSGIGTTSTSSSQMPPKQKSLNLVMREEGVKYGCDRDDHEPQLIVGTCTRDEEVIFIVLWKNKSTGEVETQGDLVPAKELWQKYPEFVLSYFENHKGWVPGWNEAESDADEENENNADQAEVPNEVDSDEDENQDVEADETGTNKEDGDIDRDKDNMIEEEEAETN